MAHDAAMNSGAAAVTDSGTVGNQFLTNYGMSTGEIAVISFIFLLIVTIFVLVIYSLYSYSHKPDNDN